MKKSITIDEANYDPTRPQMGIRYSNMATIKQALGKPMEADEWMKKSIANGEANYEPTHPQLGIHYSNMAGIQQDLGKLMEAEEWMKKSIANGEANYEPTYPQLGIRYANMAQIQRDLGKFIEAESWMKKSTANTDIDFSKTQIQLDQPREGSTLKQIIRVEIDVTDAPEDGFLWVGTMMTTGEKLMWPKEIVRQPYAGFHAIEVAENGTPPPGELGVFVLGVGMAGNAYLENWRDTAEKMGSWPGLTEGKIPGAKLLAKADNLTMQKV